MSEQICRGRIGAWTLAFAAASTVGLLHCSSPGAAPEADSEAQAESLSSPDAVTTGKSVSFLVTSDLHFGYEAGVLNSGVPGADDDEEDVTNEGDVAVDDTGSTISILQKNRQLATAMKQAETGAAGVALKANGIDNHFNGVIVTGDIADNGKEDQWVDYHHTFDAPNFDLAMYETSGNHDYPWTTAPMTYVDGSQVYDITRINARTQTAATRPHVIRWDGDKASTDSFHSGSYAWQWDDSDVVFVNLGVKASSHDDSSVPSRQGLFRSTDPFHSLHFLKEVLADVGKSKTYVLSFHYPLEAADYRMDQTERQELRDALVGYRVAAILHGHRHKASLYTWCGVPVLEIDTPRNAGPGFDSSFAAVTIDAGKIAAQTISYRYETSGTPQVSYDAVTSSTTAKDEKALCTGRSNDPNPCWYYPSHAIAAPVSQSCDVQQTRELP